MTGTCPVACLKIRYLSKAKAGISFFVEIPAFVHDSTGQAVLSKSTAVGPITKAITYAASGVVTMPKYPEADNRLRSAGLVETSGNVQRG